MNWQILIFILTRTISQISRASWVDNCEVEMKIILQIVHSAHTTHTYIMQIVQLKIRESWKPSYMIYATHRAIFEISFETERPPALMMDPYHELINAKREREKRDNWVLNLVTTLPWSWSGSTMWEIDNDSHHNQHQVMPRTEEIRFPASCEKKPSLSNPQSEGSIERSPSTHTLNFLHLNRFSSLAQKVNDDTLSELFCNYWDLIMHPGKKKWRHLLTRP